MLVPTGTAQGPYHLILSLKIKEYQGEAELYRWQYKIKKKKGKERSSLNLSQDLTCIYAHIQMK